MPPAAKAVVAAMDDFLKASPEGVLTDDNPRKQFCWRSVTVRVSRYHPEVMVFVVASSLGMYAQSWDGLLVTSMACAVNA